MTLSAFLSRLSESGIAVVDMDDAIAPDLQWQATIVEWDAVQRNELLSAPKLSLEAAGWAVERFYRGCQAIVCRDMGPNDLHRYLAAPFPEPREPAADYSVDLVFRFLPDLIALARKVSQNDPLVAELLRLAEAWPLSSVGVAGLGEISREPFLHHPGLRQLYVDRILATGDATRLTSDVVREAAGIALGAFPQMAPKIAEILKPAA